MSHTISYRLQSYDYQQTLKHARKSRCKSVHEYGRLALLSTLEEESSDSQSQQVLLEELSQLRDEVSDLRLTLAKTLQIMLTLNGYDAIAAERFIAQNILGDSQEQA